MSFTGDFLTQFQDVMSALPEERIELLAENLAQVRDAGGRLFILGVGGSAGSASHAVNDFRKLCQIEAYAPTDNVSELTARVNDEGWDTVFYEWLAISRLSSKDALLIFSVGGGDEQKNVSANLVKAMKYAQEVDAKVLGIVGREGGYTAKAAKACVVIPPLYPDKVTPITEAMCGVIWHLLVSHPRLKKVNTKWESLKQKLFS